MNKQLKAKWVQALRSGKYKQGQEHLRGIDNTFCCLGVLCDIQRRRWFRSGTYYGVRTGGNLDIGGEQDDRLLQSVGYYHLSTLIEMNDTGESFEAIADYIETNL